MLSTPGIDALICGDVGSSILKEAMVKKFIMVMLILSGLALVVTNL